MSSETPTFDDEYEDYNGRLKTPRKPRKSAAGRKLMRWNPDVDQMVLLCVDTVCAKEGVPVPWDLIAQQIEPWLTGEAVKQHLAKVRAAREASNRPVPEKLDRNVRRLTTKKAGGDVETPTATTKRRGKKASNQDKDDDEDFSKPAKNANLLFTDPKVLEKKLKQKAAAFAAAPKTPRKNTKIKEEIVVDDDSINVGRTPNHDFTTPVTPKNKTNTGTKRARVSKKTAKKIQDEDDEEETYTPNLGQDEISLRPKADVSYAEPSIFDEDEQDDNAGLLTKNEDGRDMLHYEDEDSGRKKQKMTPIKQQPRTLSANDQYGNVPPPQFSAPIGSDYFPFEHNPFGSGGNHAFQNGLDHIAHSLNHINDQNHLDSDDVFAPPPNGLPFSNRGLSSTSGFDYDVNTFGGHAAQQPDPFNATPVYDNGGFRNFGLPGDAIDMGYVGNTFSNDHTPPQLNTSFGGHDQYGTVTPRSFSKSSNGSHGGIDPKTSTPSIKQDGSFSSDSGYTTKHGSIAGLADMQADGELKDYMHGLDAGEVGGCGHDGIGDNSFHNDYFGMDDEDGYKAYLVQQQQMSQLP